jgi:hypothetical protein
MQSARSRLDILPPSSTPPVSPDRRTPDSTPTPPTGHVRNTPSHRALVPLQPGTKVPTPKVTYASSVQRPAQPLIRDLTAPYVQCRPPSATPQCPAPQRTHPSVKPPSQQASPLGLLTCHTTNRLTPPARTLPRPAHRHDAGTRLHHGTARRQVRGQVSRLSQYMPTVVSLSAASGCRSSGSPRGL